MRGPARKLRRAVVAVVLALGVAPGSAAAATETLPDLVTDPLVDRGLQDQGERLLLRMDAYIRNIGAGAVELRGSSLMGGLLTDVKQRVYNDDGSFSREIPTAAVVRYENHVDHNHFHLQAAARYSLWSEDLSREITGSEKRGFCLTDSRHSELFGPAAPAYGSGGPEFTFCSAGNPNPNPFEPVVMGISAGWRDEYRAGLAFQWVDVTNITPGRYRLGAEVDPDAIITESNELNPFAFTEERSIVPGYAPLPVKRSGLNPFRSTNLALRSEYFGREGAPEPADPSYRIVSGPSCGRLEPGRNDGALALPSVAYVPGKRCRGTVEFDYSVRNPSSSFPVKAPTATATLKIGTRRPLSRPRVVRRGRRLVVRMRSRYAGRLRATLTAGGVGVGSCATRARARRVAKCRIPLSSNDRATLRAVGGELRVRTALRLQRKVVATRRDTL